MRFSIARITVLSLGLLVVSLVIWGSWSVFRTNSAEQIYRTASDALHRGDYAQSRACLDQLRKGHTWESTAYADLLSARLQLRTGNANSALRELSTRQFSGSAHLENEALLVLGESFYQLNDLAEAQRCFFRVAAGDPSNFEAHRWLSAVYYDLGANSLARFHLKHLSELRPHDFTPHRLLGLMSRDAGDHKVAIESYEKCLSRSPPPDVRREVVYELAESLIALLEFSRALDVLTSVPMTGPTNVLKAQAFLGIGDIDSAEAALRMAEPTCANEPQFLLQRARLNIELEHWEAVAHDAKHARELDPYNPEIVYVLATANQHLHRNSEAQALMKESLRLRDLVSRLSTLTREADVQGDDPVVRDELSAISAQLGKRELSAMWARAADACRKAQSQKAVKSSATQITNASQSR
jgi:tetratricopeptide (TPR) repeat protein